MATFPIKRERRGESFEAESGNLESHPDDNRETSETKFDHESEDDYNQRMVRKQVKVEFDEIISRPTNLHKCNHCLRKFTYLANYRKHMVDGCPVLKKKNLPRVPFKPQVLKSQIEDLVIDLLREQSRQNSDALNRAKPSITESPPAPDASGSEAVSKRAVDSQLEPISSPESLKAKDAGKYKGKGKPTLKTYSRKPKLTTKSEEGADVSEQTDKDESAESLLSGDLQSPYGASDISKPIKRTSESVEFSDSPETPPSATEITPKSHRGTTDSYKTTPSTMKSAASTSKATQLSPSKNAQKTDRKGKAADEYTLRPQKSTTSSINLPASTSSSSSSGDALVPPVFVPGTTSYNSFSCSFCNQIFLSYWKLLQHRISHKLEKGTDRDASGQVMSADDALINDFNKLSQKLKTDSPQRSNLGINRATPSISKLRNNLALNIKGKFNQKIHSEAVPSSETETKLTSPRKPNNNQEQTVKKDEIKMNVEDEPTKSIPTDSKAVTKDDSAEMTLRDAVKKRQNRDQSISEVKNIPRDDLVRKETESTNVSVDEEKKSDSNKTQNVKSPDTEAIPSKIVIKKSTNALRDNSKTSQSDKSEAKKNAKVTIVKNQNKSPAKFKQDNEDDDALSLEAKEIDTPDEKSENIEDASTDDEGKKTNDVATNNAKYEKSKTKEVASNDAILPKKTAEITKNVGKSEKISDDDSRTKKSPEIGTVEPKAKRAKFLSSNSKIKKGADDAKCKKSNVGTDSPKSTKSVESITHGSKGKTPKNVGTSRAKVAKGSELSLNESDKEDEAWDDKFRSDDDDLDDPISATSHLLVNTNLSIPLTIEVSEIYDKILESNNDPEIPSDQVTVASELSRSSSTLDVSNIDASSDTSVSTVVAKPDPSPTRASLKKNSPATRKVTRSASPKGSTSKAGPSGFSSKTKTSSSETSLLATPKTRQSTAKDSKIVASKPKTSPKTSKTPAKPVAAEETSPEQSLEERTCVECSRVFANKLNKLRHYTLAHKKKRKVYSPFRPFNTKKKPSQKTTFVEEAEDEDTEEEENLDVSRNESSETALSPSTPKKTKLESHAKNSR